MNSVLTFAAAAALTFGASSAVAESNVTALSRAGPVVTNGTPMPPQVFAPEASAHAAGRSADRSVGAGPTR